MRTSTRPAGVQPQGSGETADSSLAKGKPKARCLLTFNPSEPPWYGPICLVVWEGKAREGLPYPESTQTVSPLLSGELGMGNRGPQESDSSGFQRTLTARCMLAVRLARGHAWVRMRCSIGRFLRQSR